MSFKNKQMHACTFPSILCMFFYILHPFFQSLNIWLRRCWESRYDCPVRHVKQFIPPLSADRSEKSKEISNRSMPQYQPHWRHSATKHMCMPAHITARPLCLESSAFFKYIVMHLWPWGVESYRLWIHFKLFLSLSPKFMPPLIR